MNKDGNQHAEPIGKSTNKKSTGMLSKKFEQQQKLSNNENNNTRESTTGTTSLVKYDTPFLVSTTISNKKTLEELDDNNDNAEIFLRNLINKRGGDDKSGKSEYEDYSVKDALNKILPPKKIFKNEQLWVQYVSCTPVTKAEVLNLQEGLDRRLQTMQARETGICPIREELYNECFDELIRQVTINCLERGILLMRTKKEIEMTINSYQTLYESAIAYGIRTSLIVIIYLT
jgi:dynein light intermediate chain